MRVLPDGVKERKADQTQHESSGRPNLRADITLDQSADGSVMSG